jgi:hypothetical protein
MDGNLAAQIWDQKKVGPKFQALTREYFKKKDNYQLLKKYTTAVSKCKSF